MNKRAIVIAVGALVVAAGCGSGSSGGSTPGAVGDTTPASPPSTSGSPTATATATPTATTTATTAPVSLPRCLSSALSLSLGQGQGAAGTTYTPIVFTNKGSTACQLRGYPGVSFIDAAGHLIGRPSGEDAGKIKTVKLAVGGTANALLRQPNPGNFPASACQQTTADKIRVYPPGETAALTLDDPAPVCSTKAGRTGVRPVASGDGG